MTTPPKDRPIIAKFKEWPWLTLVEWNGTQWQVVGHEAGRYYDEDQLTYWHDVGTFNRTGISRGEK